MTQTVTGVSAAVRAALAGQEVDYGVGVEGGKNWFVQWCRDEDGSFSSLEVRPPDGRPEVEQALRGRGFAPFEDLVEFGIWTVASGPGEHLFELTGEEQIATALAERLQMVGANDRMRLTVYP